MLVRAIVAEAFESNCYVVAAARGEPCLIVDPGIGVLPALDALLDAERLRPAAVLLTHGHIDHCFSVAPVCGARGVTAYVHRDDTDMVADPEKWLPLGLAGLFGGRLPYSPPQDVALLPDGGPITVAGLEILVDHAPGHTRGSVLFRLAGGAGVLDAPQVLDQLRATDARGRAQPWAGGDICLSGDVLFAGSIGRTDLPGGSTAAMRRSLRDKILPLDDATVVLPGHGPATTIGRERRTNPYLVDIDAW